MATTNIKEQSLGELNVSKATAASPLGGSLNFLEGKLKCECVNVEAKPKSDGSGKVNVAFQLKVVEPQQYSGKVFNKTNPAIGDPKGENFWRTTMEAFGYTGAQLGGKIDLKPSTFVGRKCLVYYRPKKDGEKYDHREFLTPADFKMAEWAKEGTQEAAGIPAPAAAANADDLFNN